ncbi:MAG: ABC transporter permease [Acidobacteriota bacterium]
MEPATHYTAAVRRLRTAPSVRAVCLGVAVALFIALGVLPVVYMFGLSFTGANGSVTLNNYRQLFIESRQRELLLTSALLGTGSALLATGLGAPLGLLLARCPLPAKRLLRIVLVVPLVVPPYVLALSWILVSGPAGLLAKALGRDVLSGWTYSLTGAIVVLGLNLYPLSMLATEAAARRVDGHLEEAALLVSRPRRVLWRITLPLIAPTVAAVALIIFVLAVSEFGVPGLLRVRVFTTEVFTAFAAFYDFGAGVALATPLLAVALIAGTVIKLITGEHVLATRRSTHTGLSLPLHRFRAPVLAGLGLIIFTSVLLPLAALAVEAGGVNRVVFTARASSDAITNSLSLAAISATLIVALAVVLGYGRARARTRVRSYFDLAFILIFAVPSTVVGVGLIALWNRPGWLGSIYSSPAIIVVAYLARFVPVAALILAASVRQVPTSFEEVAEVSGASWPRTFARIVVPNIWTGIAAAWVVAFIFAFGELGATILVAPPGESTLPVRVYTLIANTPPSEVAALALMQIGVILIPLGLLGTLAAGKRREQP